MKKALMLLLLLYVGKNEAQTVSVNTSGSKGDPSSMLDVSSPSKGMLIPRMNTSGINTIVKPAKGLLVYDSSINQFKVNVGNATSPNWQPLGASGTAWNLTGNGGTNSAQNFIGTTDAQPLMLRVKNTWAGIIDSTLNNTAIGFKSLIANSTGVNNAAVGSNTLLSGTPGNYNTAVGYGALRINGTGANTGIDEATRNTAIGAYSMYVNTTGGYNTAVGFSSLGANTSGFFNTALGYGSLAANVNGRDNTALGLSALNLNAGGQYNTAIGSRALEANTSGVNNTAEGATALYLNTDGQQNTANGYAALYSNISGSYNTATGAHTLNNNTASWNTADGTYALYSNTTGIENTASGYMSMYNNSKGTFNTANGSYALYRNTVASYNTATGSHAMYLHKEGAFNTAVGYQALARDSVGEQNTAIGAKALYNNYYYSNPTYYDYYVGSRNTGIGFSALYSNEWGESNTAVGNEALAYGGENTYYSTAIGDGAMKYSGGSSNTAVGYSCMGYGVGQGESNTAVGESAIGYNTTGQKNTAIGVNTLLHNTTGNENVVIGYNAAKGTDETDHNGCVFIGTSSGSSGSKNYSVAIGYAARVDADYQIRIGNSYTTSIGGYVGWSNISDGRYKMNLREDVKGLDFILKLRPVTYNLNLKSLNAIDHIPDSIGRSIDLNREKVRYTGFVAQEVESAAQSVNFNFSGIDKPDKPDGKYSLRYAEFVVPLVKAVQEQQQEIKKLQRGIDHEKETNEALQKVIAQQHEQIILLNQRLQRLEVKSN